MTDPQLEALRERMWAALDRTLKVQLMMDGHLLERQVMNGKAAYQHALTLYGPTHVVVPKLSPDLLIIEVSA